MSVEDILIAQAHPQILAAKINHLTQREMEKGCSPYIHSRPVALEPNFQSIHELAQRQGSQPCQEAVFITPSQYLIFPYKIKFS